MTDRRLRILICEDDERLATLVTDTLAADGRFEVVARATNGEEAIRLTEEHGPDLVLMDIGMPGLDGIDATRAIRARDSAQHVVIYTGSAEYEDIGRADEVGAAGFLHKEALTSPDLPDALQVLHTNYTSARTDPD